MELWVKRYDRLTIRDQYVKKIITNGALAENQIASFSEIRFPERKAHSNPKKRKNTLSVIESALSSNTLSRGENDFAPGARPLIQRGAPRLADRWAQRQGQRGRGPPGLLLPHARGRVRQREGIAPTAIAGASGHLSRRPTYPRAQENEAHLLVGSVAGEERGRRSSRARGGEGLRALVGMGFWWGKRRGGEPGRIDGEWRVHP